MKIRSVGAELLNGDRRTDMTNGTVAFRNFTNAPKNFFMVSGNRTSYLSIYFSHFCFFRGTLWTCTALARSVNYIWQSEQHICNLHMK